MCTHAKWIWCQMDRGQRCLRGAKGSVDYSRCSGAMFVSPSWELLDLSFRTTSVSLFTARSREGKRQTLITTSIGAIAGMV
jgi:hypothetical protein